ncbi:hypothetical protein [Amycolatopsis suaedae]|uniref:Uncharacterized protein n=1 Tax=Amycolatopsis suaedae TaxID=2510978 RepID=A0A4Q7J0Z3_9PSEU|nr:hypothetical protein [Amycolatopsis suaedae]RZQ61031.1 hypothetical protein EWH70_26575 [Amycolatopsis suaedae]
MLKHLIPDFEEFEYVGGGSCTTACVGLRISGGAFTSCKLDDGADTTSDRVGINAQPILSVSEIARYQRKGTQASVVTPGIYYRGSIASDGRAIAFVAQVTVDGSSFSISLGES